MISKSTKYYCCEDISMIENYELAIADTTQIWECHHRAEVLNGIKMFSDNELKQLNLYLGRPAKELIFVTRSEHRKIHCEIGKKSAKTLLQYTKAGDFVREWASALEVQRQLGINHNSISRCCTGRYKSAGGFVWRFK